MADPVPTALLYSPASVTSQPPYKEILMSVVDVLPQLIVAPDAECGKKNQRASRAAWFLLAMRCGFRHGVIGRVSGANVDIDDIGIDVGKFAVALRIFRNM